MLKLLLQPLTELGEVWLKGRVAKAAAQSQLELERTRAKSAVVAKVTAGELEWNQAMAEASADSWKDEWLTILVSIPLVLAFTGNTELVTRGFAALEAMPDFYQATVGVVFAASFGVQKLTKMFQARAQ